MQLHLDKNFNFLSKSYAFISLSSIEILSKLKRKVAEEIVTP